MRDGKELELDKEALKNKVLYLRDEVCRLFPKEFSVSPELAGQILVVESIDKLTAKVSELIEVLKERE